MTFFWLGVLAAFWFSSLLTLAAVRNYVLVEKIDAQDAIVGARSRSRVGETVRPKTDS